MSDQDDKDYAIRAPYIQKILELEQRIAELQKKNDEQFASMFDVASERDRLVRECAILKDRDAHNMYVATQLEQRVKVLTDGLRALNYTASASSPNACIVRELLRMTPQQTAEQIERWHIEWMMKLPVVGWCGQDKTPHAVRNIADGTLRMFIDQGKALVAIPKLPETKE